MSQKGCCKFFLIVFFVIFIVLLYTYLNRHFFVIGNKDFTFWRSSKGCYIMPYKYFGIFPPKKNYALSSNTCFVHIFIENDSIIHFLSYSYRIENNDNLVEFYLESSPYTYLQRRNKNYEKFDSLQLHYTNIGLPNLFVDNKRLW